MKKLILTSFLFIFSAITFAQEGINYKALIKDANGDAITSQAVTIQFQILQDGITNVYQETHNPTTDANGIAFVNIGEGTVDSGNFVAIDWGVDDHFLNVQVDTGDGLIDLGTTAFKSVPYSKMADLATNVKNSPVSEFALAKAISTSSFGGTFSPVKIPFHSEEHDLTDNFEPDPNFTFNPVLSRFTVTEPGYYNINADMGGYFIGISEYFSVVLFIQKNGASIKQNRYATVTEDIGYPNRMTTAVSTIEYLVPGDYIELFGQVNNGATASGATIEITRIR